MKGNGCASLIIVVSLLAFVSALILNWTGYGSFKNDEKKGLSNWHSARYSSSENSWLNTNFYESHRAYPNYGIAFHHFRSDMTIGSSKKEIYANALNICRSDFITAYNNGTLNDFGPPEQSFSPEYVCFIFDDWSNRAISDDRQAVFLAGIVVDAKQLFSKDFPIEDLLANSFKSNEAFRVIVSENPESSLPKREFSIIKAHIKSLEKTKEN